MNREELVKQANEMPLGDLAKQVVSGSYTDGIHNAVLIERCIPITKSNDELRALTIKFLADLVCIDVEDIDHQTKELINRESMVLLAIKFKREALSHE